MRIINVIQCFDNTVMDIYSFGVYEEQLSQDVVEEAEKKFKELVSSLGPNDEDEIENYVEDGFYSHGITSVSIMWSDI